MTRKGYYNQLETNDVSGDTSNSAQMSSLASQNILRMAMVVKVITTPTVAHQSGTVQFRIFNETGKLASTPLELLPYARPVNTLFVSLPAMGEYIYVMRGPGVASTRPDQEYKETPMWYYMTPISVRGDINHNTSTDHWQVNSQSKVL